MTSSFTLFRIRGIPIGAHWSWLFVFALVVWSLSTSLFPATYPGRSDATYLVMGAIAGILFFVSVLLHELGHAFRALKEGLRMEGITLWLFGGVARFSGLFPTAGAEFRIAIAGPLVSVALVVAFGALAAVAGALDAPGAMEGVADYLARINLLLVAFNLVPALPLDGGRVLRAWLWHRQGSFSAATRSAVRAGMAFGGLLIAVGLLDFVTGGGGGGGLWLVFIGWFLLQAAQGEATAALMQQVLRGRRVRDFMTPEPQTVDPAMSVARFLEEVVGAKGHSTYPVTDDGRLVGLVSLRGAGAVPLERRGGPVSEIMVGSDAVPTLSADAEMADALAPLQEEARRAVVVEEGRVVGILAASDVTRALEVERVMGRREPERVRSSGVLVWLVVGAIMLAAGAFFYHPPIVVLEPGPTVDVTGDITISGVPIDQVNGRYMLTSVRLARPNALFALGAALLSDREVLPLSQVIPAGSDSGRFFQQQREIFQQSQELAAAAAATAAGLEVSVTGSGAIVSDLLAGSPAEEVLRRGDVIVAVNGAEIDVAPQLQNAIRSRPAGTTFDMEIERDGADRSVELRSTQLPGLAEGSVGVGVLVTTRDFGVDLPFEVEFEERAIGGPSAGLAYALAISDMLEPADLAGGATIAATGTIEAGGDVGPVGGVGAKAESVEAADADLFLVPAAEVDQAEIEGLDVRGVRDLDEALDVLQSTTAAL